MSVYKIDTEQLDNAINSFDKAKDTLNQIVNDCRNLTYRIRESWDGEAARAYELKLHSQSESLTKIVDGVDGIVKNTKQIKQEIEEVDRKVNNYTTRDIFEAIGYSSNSNKAHNGDGRRI